MNRRCRVAAAAFAGVALLLAAAGSAQDCSLPEPFPVDEADLVFDAFLVRGCFGGDACFGVESELCTGIEAWVAADGGDDPASAAPWFASIRRQAALLAAEAPTDRAVSRLRRELDEWERILAAADADRLPSAAWQPDGLVLFSGDEPIDTVALLAEGCGAGEAACREAFERLGAVWTLALSQRTLLLELAENRREATVRYLAGLDSRWRSYLLGGRSLFPWERWLNAELWRRSLESERGFVEPPRRQFVLLHPEAAYEYRDWEADGLEESVVLELAGFYRWRWNEDGSMGRPWGGSVVLAWDGASSDPFGWGVMVHLPRNWSLGLVARDDPAAGDSVAVLLAADLPKLFVDTVRLRDRLTSLRFDP